MADGADSGAARGDREAGATARLIERSIALLLVLGLLLGVAAILLPFVTAILFGAILAIATWPLRAWMIRRGLPPGLAAALLLAGSLAVVLLPALLLAPGLAEQLAAGAERARAYAGSLPARPDWLARVPLAGESLVRGWDALLGAGGDIGALLAPYAEQLQRILVRIGRALADSLLQLVLSLVVATAFWVQGAALGAALRDIARRLGGGMAERGLESAGGAVRGVAYGVVGTAVIQGAILGAGFALAGVPGAAMLGFVALLLALSQIGAPLLILLWGGAAAWLFQSGAQGWGIFVVAVGLFIGTIDNILKPWLIGLGVRMPLSLIVLGVFGGFLTHGFLGLFIGPALMAVAFTLLQAWRAGAQGEA